MSTEPYRHVDNTSSPSEVVRVSHNGKSNIEDDATSLTQIFDRGVGVDVHADHAIYNGAMNIELAAIPNSGKELEPGSKSSSSSDHDGDSEESASSSTSIEKPTSHGHRATAEKTGISLREGLTDWHYLLRMVAALSAHFTFPSVLYHLTLHLRNNGVDAVRSWVGRVV